MIAWIHIYVISAYSWQIFTVQILRHFNEFLLGKTLFHFVVCSNFQNCKPNIN
jgi:hypothetical protein